MKTVEKMRHVRRFDTVDYRGLSDIAQTVYSCSSDVIFVRGTHEFEWVGDRCIESFSDMYEVHSGNSINSDLVYECDSIDDLSAYFEGLYND